MPIEYKVYGCKFKCGKKHISSKKKMEEHEAICWANPENKSCRTCSHLDRQWFGDRCKKLNKILWTWNNIDDVHCNCMTRECLVVYREPDDIDVFMQLGAEKRVDSGMLDACYGCDCKDMPMRKHCPHWEQK